MTFRLWRRFARRCVTAPVPVASPSVTSAEVSMLALLVWLIVPPASYVPGGLPFLDMLRDSPTGRLYWLAYEEKQLQKRSNSAYGRVVALTDDTITIRGCSGFERAFEVSPEVASKAIPLDSQRWLCAHRLNQVRVGDLVNVKLAPTARGNVVTALGIRRRLGGNIPPSEDKLLEGRAHPGEVSHFQHGEHVPRAGGREAVPAAERAADAPPVRPLSRPSRLAPAITAAGATRRSPPSRRPGPPATALAPDRPTRR